MSVKRRGCRQRACIFLGVCCMTWLDVGCDVLSHNHHRRKRTLRVPVLLFVRRRDKMQVQTREKGYTTIGKKAWES